MNNKSKNPEYLLKMSFVAIGIVVVFAIILGSWIWNLIFDPSHFDINKWATRAVFNNALAIAMMVLGFIAVNETLKSKENGKYQLRLEAFNDAVNDLFITGRIIYFDQFISWYAERQVREKKIKHLTKHGMPRMDAEVVVDYALISDIEVISGLKFGEKPQGRIGKDIVRKNKNGKEILIPAIRDTLAAYVEEVLNGAVTVDAETASYYTSADKNRAKDLTSLEKPQATEQDRVVSMRRSFLSKAISGIVYITIISLLVVDLSSGAGTPEAVWAFILRIGAATIGFLSGGFAGSTNASFLYKWVGEKMRVVKEYNRFYDSGEFKPKTYEESAQERIKAVHLEEEKEEQKVEKIIENDNIATIFATQNEEKTIAK